MPFPVPIIKRGAPVLCVGAPAAPASLTARAMAHLWVNLAWVDTASNKLGFKIERSADGLTGWTQIGTTEADDNYYSDIDVEAGETWYYRVRAYNTYNGDYSNVAGATLVTFSLKANFNTDNQNYSNGQALDAAGEGVQAGSLTVVDTSTGSLALASRKLAFTPSGQANQTGFFSNGLTRTPGQGIFTTFTANALNAINTLRINNAGALAEANKLFQLNIAGDGYVYPIFWNPGNSNLLFSKTDAQYTASAPYEICIIFGGYNAAGEPYRTGETLADYGYGYTMYIRGGAYPEWFRIWNDQRDNTGTLYWVLDALNTNGGTLDNIEMSNYDLSAALLPTDYVAAPIVGTTFDHDSDCWIEFTVDTLPASGEIQVDYRIQDGDNRRRIIVEADGGLSVGRVAGGTYTEETARTGLVNGSKVIVHSAGERFVEFVDRALSVSQAWTAMAPGGSFAGNTSGAVTSLGTGGAISDLVTHTLYLPSLLYSEVFFDERQTVLTGNATHEDLNALEPSVIREGNGQILSGTVWKMWYTGGWSGGDYEPSMNYAESPDGVTWTKYSGNPILPGYFRGDVFKYGSTYFAYTVRSTGANAEKQMDLYTSTDGVNWTLDTAGVIGLGTAGAWDDGFVANPFIWVEGSTWYMVYEARRVATVWKIGLATSPDGRVWTKSASNPVITDTGSVGGPFVQKVGSTYFMWAHRCVGGSGYLPTDITSYTSTDLVTWTLHPDGLRFVRQMADEGVGGSQGQVADPTLLEVGGQVILFYIATTDGGEPTGQQHIKRAVFDGAWEALISQ